MDAEMPDNLPLSETWSTFNKQEKAVQLNSYKWRNIQLGESKEINGTKDIVKKILGERKNLPHHIQEKSICKWLWVLLGSDVRW